MKKRHWVMLFALLLIHLLVLVNSRFEAWPEMLVYPYLNLHRFLQYKDIVHPYPPLGIWLLSFWFRLVGISIANLKIFTWGLIIGIDAFLFRIASKKSGTSSALVGLSFFVLFQPLLDGNGLWFDLMLIPILLTAFYWQSPVLLSAAFFFKQTTLWLFPLFFKQWKKLAVSLATLFLVSCFLFLLSGTLKDYLFWSWQFPFTIFPNMPGHKDLGNWRLWILGVTPLLLPLMMKIITSKKLPKMSATEPLWWMILSTAFIFPRFGLFHFQPALAFASLSLAHSWKAVKKSWVALSLIPYSLFLGALWLRQSRLWHQPTRFFEPEIIQAGTSLKTITTPDRPVLFLNAPDQLMVLADRLPPKPWIATFPWYLEVAKVQSNTVLRWSPQPIQAVVFSPYQQSGDKYTPGSYTPYEINEFVRWNFPVTSSLNPSIHVKSALPK